MNTYATSADLDLWLSGLDLEAPDDAEGMLRTATVMVARAANRNPYTDVLTVPDAVVLKDATTAQVASWVSLGITPSAAGLESAPVKSTKIGTADVTYDTTGQADKRETVATELAPEAMQILIAGGLFALDLPVFTDDTDRLADYGMPRVRVQSSCRFSPWWLS